MSLTTHDIVQKIIGPVSPVGDSAVDATRLENLRDLCALVDGLIFDIQLIAEATDDHLASVKAAKDLAASYLVDWRAADGVQPTALSDKEIDVLTAHAMLAVPDPLAWGRLGEGGGDMLRAFGRALARALAGSSTDGVQPAADCPNVKGNPREGYYCDECGSGPCTSGMKGGGDAR
jgi:hypothetical protein